MLASLEAGYPLTASHGRIWLQRASPSTAKPNGTLSILGQAADFITKKLAKLMSNQYKVGTPIVQQLQRFKQPSHHITPVRQNFALNETVYNPLA